MDMQLLKQLKQMEVNFNQPWTAILKELQEKNVSLLDRIGTCQDEEQLGKLQRLQSQVESLCGEVDQLLSTGMSLEPPKTDNAATGQGGTVTPQAAAGMKTGGNAQSAPVAPKAAGAAVSDKMGDAMSHYVAKQNAPKSSFQLDSSGKILEKYTGDGGDVVIPQGITEIQSDAFRKCATLKSVTFPSSLRWIGTSAFRECISLRSVSVPQGGIGRSAFCDCPNLCEVTISKNVTEIGDWAFGDCIRLENVDIAPGVTDIGKSAFSGCNHLRTITIPQGVTNIGGYAFNECVRLQSVTLPKSLSRIEDYFFQDCTNLEQVSIPSGIVQIGENAFRKCSALQKLTIPEGVTKINAWAFVHCTQLRSLTLPRSLRDIGYAAFYECNQGLLTIYAPSGSYAQEYAKNNGMNFRAL